MTLKIVVSDHLYSLLQADELPLLMFLRDTHSKLIDKY
jgi:hypothetical protein